MVWGVRQARLWQLGKLMPAHLAQHMEAYGTLPVRCAFWHTPIQLAGTETESAVCLRQHFSIRFWQAALRFALFRCAVRCWSVQIEAEGCLPVIICATYKGLKTA